MSHNIPAVTAMGFDYGKKNIGVAVGQTLTRSANALAVVRYGETRQSRAALMQQLEKLVREWRPSTLVVGWPLNMDGSESELCAEVKKFAAELQTTTGIVVEFVDERLTSQEAKTNAGGKSRNYRKEPIDSEAARLLLESWLRGYSQGQFMNCPCKI